MDQQQPFFFTYIAYHEDATIFDTKWIPQSAKFIAIGRKSNSIGLIKVFELNADRLDVVHEINNKNSFKCAAFGLSRTHQSYLAVGDFNGALQIINVDRLDSFLYNVPDAHCGIINAIDTVGSVENHGASEIVTGGKDGFVKVWDPRQNNDPVVKIEPDEQIGDTARDCWSVAFGDSYNNDERCVCAGFDNGDVKVFDLRTLQVRWESNVRNGVCSIETNNKYEKLDELVVSTTHGGLNIFSNIDGDFSGIPIISRKDADELPSNQRNHIDDIQRKENTPTVWCVKHLPQNRNIFATCGGSGTMRLWQKPNKGTPKSTSHSNELKLIHKFSISNQAVNCFDWCADRMGLGVCSSFDKTIRVIASVNLPMN